jgi:hypothetical protein
MSRIMVLLQSSTCYTDIKISQMCSSIKMCNACTFYTLRHILHVLISHMPWMPMDCISIGRILCLSNMSAAYLEPVQGQNCRVEHQPKKNLILILAGPGNCAVWRNFLHWAQPQPEVASPPNLRNRSDPVSQISFSFS